VGTKERSRRDVPANTERGKQVFSPAIAYVRYLSARLGDDRGATMVEYAIMVALIAAVSILVIGFLGLDVLDAFLDAETKFDGSAGG